MKTLSHAWRSVRRDFFPRFDKASRWKVSSGHFTSMLDESGYCDTDSKRILVAPHLARAGGDARGDQSTDQPKQHPFHVPPCLLIRYAKPAQRVLY